MAKPKQISDVQLLAAAKKVFLKHGPNVPVAVIAKQLGVTAGALFYHFASKEELLLAALDPGVPPAIAIFRKGLQPSIPAERQMIDILVGIASYMRESIACLFSLRSAGLPQGMDKYMSNPTKLRPAMTAWIKSAQQRGAIRSGDPKILTEALLAPVEMRFMLVHLLHHKHSTAASDRAFVEGVVRDVLQARPAKARPRAGKKK